MADLSGGVRNYLAHSPEYRPTRLDLRRQEKSEDSDHWLRCRARSARSSLLRRLLDHRCRDQPDINDIVTRRMREQWGGLFEQPEVHLVTEDGRSYVRRSQGKYDAIISIQTMSTAAITSGGLTLAETYVLTLRSLRAIISTT